MKCFERNVGKFCLLILLLCVTGIAEAQSTQPWDTNILSWSLPTTCSTGEAISACPLTGIRVEESSASAGSYSVVTTLPAISTTYTIVNVSAGTHFYRVIALSAGGNSVPSNVVSKTNTKPVGPPNPPVLKVIDTVAYNVVPDLQHFMFFAGSRIATVKLGSACDETRRTEDGFNVISRLTQVTPRPKAGTVLVAKCGA